MARFTLQTSKLSLSISLFFPFLSFPFLLLRYEKADRDIFISLGARLSKLTLWISTIAK